jgi:hypothetical protein
MAACGVPFAHVDRFVSRPFDNEGNPVCYFPSLLVSADAGGLIASFTIRWYHYDARSASFVAFSDTTDFLKQRQARTTLVDRNGGVFNGGTTNEYPKSDFTNDGTDMVFVPTEPWYWASPLEDKKRFEVKDMVGKYRMFSIEQPRCGRTALAEGGATSKERVAAAIKHAPVDTAPLGFNVVDCCSTGV